MEGLEHVSDPTKQTRQDLTSLDLVDATWDYDGRTLRSRGNLGVESRQQNPRGSHVQKPILTREDKMNHDRIRVLMLDCTMQITDVT